MESEHNGIVSEDSQNSLSDLEQFDRKQGTREHLASSLDSPVSSLIPTLEDKCSLDTRSFHFSFTSTSRSTLRRGAFRTSVDLLTPHSELQTPASNEEKPLRTSPTSSASTPNSPSSPSSYDGSSGLPFHFYILTPPLPDSIIPRYPPPFNLDTDTSPLVHNNNNNNNNSNISNNNNNNNKNNPNNFIFNFSPDAGYSNRTLNVTTTTTSSSASSAPISIAKVGSRRSLQELFESSALNTSPNLTPLSISLPSFSPPSTSLFPESENASNANTNNGISSINTTNCTQGSTPIEHEPQQTHITTTTTTTTTTSSQQQQQQATTLFSPPDEDPVPSFLLHRFPASPYRSPARPTSHSYTLLRSGNNFTTRSLQRRFSVAGTNRFSDVKNLSLPSSPLSLPPASIPFDSARTECEEADQQLAYDSSDGSENCCCEQEETTLATTTTTTTTQTKNIENEGDQPVELLSIEKGFMASRFKSRLSKSAIIFTPPNANCCGSPQRKRSRDDCCIENNSPLFFKPIPFPKITTNSLKTSEEFENFDINDDESNNNNNNNDNMNDDNECGIKDPLTSILQLPTITGYKAGLNYISCDTLVELIDGRFPKLVDYYSIIDCRYPYEFNGGHINGAINLYNDYQIYSHFLNDPPPPNEGNTQTQLLIFHCEFSSQRGPNLSKYLRKMDRIINIQHYPSLSYPQIYILQGGYKQFFNQYQGKFTTPQNYVPMNAKEHMPDLKENTRLKNMIKRSRSLCLF